MKRTLSLLLAAALCALLACPAAAASAQPWLQVSGQSVSLQGLPGQCNGVQITLKLNREAAGSFQFAQALSAAGTHATYTVSGDSLTLYVTSRAALGQGGALPLGALSGQGLAVTGVASLELLSVDSNGAQSNSYGSVAVKTGSSNQGGGYNPTPDGNWGGVTRYPVGTASGATGGSLQFSATHAAAGETVSFTTSPSPGYILNSLAVTDGAGRGVAVSGLGGGKWSFVMPASPVTVSAAFAPAQPAALPFRDVGQNDWFRDAVAYVYNARLMNGMEPGLFSPGGTTTRAMIVTILHRYEGSPAAGLSSFPDVPSGEYYAAPVAWAAANGVVKGYENGLFLPQDPITREQMAAILYRYAQRKGLDVSGRADLSAYWDAGQINPYAADAMSWAVHTGLITGVDSHTLQPGGSAIRAQVAAILMRFCQYIEAR